MKKLFLMLAVSLFVTNTFAKTPGFAMVWQDSQVPELPNYTDPVIEQTITDDDTPL